MNPLCWPNFADADAAAAVNSADFDASVYVETSKKQRLTKAAFTYVDVEDAGNSSIPGWEDWKC